jgi:hypothetical protein
MVALKGGRDGSTVFSADECIDVPSLAVSEHGRRLMFELLVPPEQSQLEAVGGDFDGFDREVRPWPGPGLPGIGTRRPRRLSRSASTRGDSEVIIDSKADWTSCQLEEDVEEVRSRTSVCRWGGLARQPAPYSRERTSHCWGPQRQLIRGLTMEAVK